MIQNPEFRLPADFQNNTQTYSVHDIDNILQAIPAGVMLITPEGLIWYINSTGKDLLGLGEGETCIGEPSSAFFKRPNVAVDLDDFIHTPVPRIEFTLTDRKGNEIPVIKSSSSVNIGDEKFFLETFVDITDRKRKLADLNESRRQFASMIGNLPGLVYRCRNDHEWTMEFISEGCREITGYDPDDVMYNKVISYNQIIHPDDQERVWNTVQELVLTGKAYTLEYRIRTADGKIKWVFEKANGIFSPDGGLLHIEGFISDVSEIHRAAILQEVLFNIANAAFAARSSEELFQVIHNNLGNIIDVENFLVAMYDAITDTISLPYQVDLKDKFAKFPAGKTLTGYVIRTGKPLLATRNEIEKLAEDGHIQIIGTPAEVWLGVPMKLSESIIGVLVVQSYDNPKRYNQKDMELLSFVSEQIAASVARRSAEDMLQREKAYLDQLFEGSPEAIVMISTEGTIMKVNTEFCKLFGYTSGEVIGKNIDDLIAPPEHRQDAIRITNEIAHGKDYEVETQRRHKNGHLIDVSLLVTPIMLQNSIFGAYGIYRDITARKQTEKSLISAKEKAEGADRLKSAFLSNMSHEIRTPMNAILGFSSLLSDPGLSDQERNEFIQIIRERGNDLMKIIEDIIDISKIESGQINFEIKECPVNILLNNILVTLNELKRRHGKTEVELLYHPGKPEPEFTIPTDGNRLRQILTNLIENALKFTERGFVDFGYVLNPQSPEPCIEFFVKDTGIGISPENHSLIFERFRQADDTATRKYGGTGLGLTISRNLARLLGGEIWLDSEEGKGTTFYLRLPLPSSNVAPSVHPRNPKPVTGARQKWPGKSILVVEDEESNYFLLERILRNTGMKITWAHNGIEAIELIKQHPYDIVMMDVRMPILDGYETTQAIRKFNTDLVIIAQTAFALKGEREKALAAGCSNYIAKPIDISELYTILAKYLNH